MGVILCPQCGSYEVACLTCKAKDAEIARLKEAGGKMKLIESLEDERLSSKINISNWKVLVDSLRASLSREAALRERAEKAEVENTRLAQQLSVWRRSSSLEDRP